MSFPDKRHNISAIPNYPKIDVSTYESNCSVARRINDTCVRFPDQCTVSSSPIDRAEMLCASTKQLSNWSAASCSDTAVAGAHHVSVLPPLSFAMPRRRLVIPILACTRDERMSGAGKLTGKVSTFAAALLASTVDRMFSSLVTGSTLKTVPVSQAARCPVAK